jgi:putative ABC transport system permease protein
MDRVKGWWKRLRGTLRRRVVERELSEELAFHLDLEIEQNLARGMTPGEARRAAHVAFGGVERHAERVREVRNFGWLEEVMQDLRHALRSYRRTPGFTLVVVFTLALGIGGATTIFSLVDAVLLKPLPYSDPDRLVHVWETNTEGQDFSASEANFLDFASSNRTLSALGAYRLDAMPLGGEAPAQVLALAASHALAEVLGAQLTLGRMFSSEEDRPGRDNRVVVLSDAFWRTRFAGDPGIMGRLLVLGGESYTVVGVLSKSSNFMRADLWRPLTADVNSDRTDHWLGMVGRLAPGVTREQATADLAGIAREIGTAHPEVAGWGVRVLPLSEWLVEASARQAGVLLLAAVTFLLLIACANVTNLLLARATSRQTDCSVRVTLGAGAGRLTRQWLTESALLAVAGAVLGVIGAFWAVAVVRSAALQVGGPKFLPRIEEAGVDLRMLAFAAGVTAVTALLVGLLPARLAARVDVHSVLKHGARAGTPRSQQVLRDSLVVCQITVAVLLLLGGGLMMRSLVRLHSVDPGFRTEDLWSVRLQPLETHYPEVWQRARFFNVVTAQLERIPGVIAAGATVVDPFSGFNLVNDVTPEDRAAQTPASGFMQAAWRIVTPDGYFEAAGVPLLRGRLFSFEQDRYDGEGAVVITHSMAERMWPGEDPIGKRLFWGGTQGRTRTVIGVVGDIQDVALESPMQPTMFLSSSQIVWPWMVVLVRTAGDITGIADAMRRAVHEVDPNIVVPEIRRVRDNRAATLAQPRFQAWILAGFAAVALALAAVGLYGLLAFTVAQRTREIGVRMALGARPDAVLALMIRRGLALTLAGLVFGLAAGAALTRLIQSLLYNTAPLDPLTFAAVPALFAFVALIATALPAYRAARVDPLVALRSD